MWNMDDFRHDLHLTVKYSRAPSAPTTTKLFPPQTQGGTVDEASSTISLREGVPRLGDLRRVRAFVVVAGPVRDVAFEACDDGLSLFIAFLLWRSAV
jgi:hypothetical protein